MKVILKEREYDYTSDFPNNWKESSGDFFKYPVQIGKYQTFIKRFERKRPEDISGWNLLINLKGRFVPNLPRVFDIESMEENRKEVYYLFQEYLEGQTLDKAVGAGTGIDLKRLTNDLFIALKNLHDNDFWFADFCMKNIFFEEERRRFVLIDLDSAQPISHKPSTDMWADKEYWALVFDFYKKILVNKEFKSTDISGPVLNYLMIIFLVLRLKITSGDHYYKPGQLHAILPAILDATDPAFRECFSRALSEDTKVHFTGWTDEVKNMIFTKLIDKDIEVDLDGLIRNIMPVINCFTSDKLSVLGGDPFSLEWQAENVISLELHKNGLFLKKLNTGQTSISISEFFDGKPRRIQYTLVASNNAGITKSKPVTVLITEDADVTAPETTHSSKPIVEEYPVYENVTENDAEDDNEATTNLNTPNTNDAIKKDITKAEANNNDTSQGTIFIDVNKNPNGNGEEIYRNGKKDREKKLRRIRLSLFGLLLAIIVASAIILYYFSFPGKVKITILRYSLAEGNSLVIFANNFPKDSSKVQVLFNNIKGDIIEYSQTSMQVIVPKLGSNLRDGSVKVAVVIKGDTTFADHTITVKENTKPGQDTTTPHITIISPAKDSLLPSKPVKIVVKNNQVKKQMKTDTASKVALVIKQPEVEKEKKKNINIYDFVTVSSSEVKTGFMRLSKKLKITVENNSPYELDSVNVEVSYLKGNEEIVRNEIKTFIKIASHNSSTIELPGYHKGKKLVLKIVSISSQQMEKEMQ